MLIFHCTDCNEEIDCLDHERSDQAFTNLDEHIAKCALATFTIEGTTDIARQRADDIRAVVKYNRLAGKLQLPANQPKFTEI